eukprot:756178-Alexandrium_andersonii.AAC.1
MRAGLECAQVLCGAALVHALRGACVCQLICLWCAQASPNDHGIDADEEAMGTETASPHGSADMTPTDAPCDEDATAA